MPTPRPVSKRLREMLGSEAAETMVDWLDGLGEHREAARQEARADSAELRQETVGLRADVRADIAELRQEMAGLRADLRSEVVMLRADMQAGFSSAKQETVELRAEMRAGFAAIDAKFAQFHEDTRVGFAELRRELADRNATLMKWMVGFWLASFVGIIGSIIALGRIIH